MALQMPYACKKRKGLSRMNGRKGVLLVPLLIGAVAFGFTCHRSPETQSAATITAAPSPGSTSVPTATYTPPPSLIMTTIDDAVRFVTPLFTGHGSTLILAQPQSVSYVETTAGQARAMFEPNRPGGWGVPDSAQVWAIVAYGQFELGSLWPQPTPGTPALPATAAWFVVVERSTAYFFDGYSSAQYDLSRLGTVVKLSPSQWQKHCSPCSLGGATSVPPATPAP